VALRRRSGKREDESFPGFTDVVRIGAGGFSTVFRAREVETNRTVALKILNVHDVSEHAIGSFQRETFALGTLSAHPNIVTLYRILTTEDDRPVLVLELCHGSIWERTRDQGAMAPWESVAVAVKIAGALETAHRAGMLHRDIKPENVLITQYGEPALADFGVARLQSTSQATAGVFGFTTIHAAPELLEGRDLSAATDVYGLASTLYQLLAGKAAFRSFEDEGPASVILRILRDPVQPLVVEGVPVALSDLLVSSMSKNPYDRPASALELADELRSIEAAASWPDTPYAIEETVAVEHTAPIRPGRFQVRGVDAPWETPDDLPAERPAVPQILSQPGPRPDAPPTPADGIDAPLREAEAEPAASGELESASGETEPAASGEPVNARSNDGETEAEPAASGGSVKSPAKGEPSPSRHQPDPASETVFVRSGPGRVDVPRRERRVITPQGRPAPAAPVPIRPPAATEGAPPPTSRSATPASPPPAAAEPSERPPLPPVTPHFPARPTTAAPPPPPAPGTRHRRAQDAGPLPPPPVAAAPPRSDAGTPPPPVAAAPPRPNAGAPRRPAAPVTPPKPPKTPSPVEPEPVAQERARHAEPPVEIVFPLAPDPVDARPEPMVSDPEPMPAVLEAQPEVEQEKEAPEQEAPEQEQEQEQEQERSHEPQPEPKPEPTVAEQEAAEQERSQDPEPEPKPERDRREPEPVEPERAVAGTGPVRVEPARFNPPQREPRRTQPQNLPAKPEPSEAPAARHAPAPRFDHLFDEEEERAVPTIRPLAPPVAATTAQHSTSWARPRFLSQSFSMDLDDDSHERRTRPTPVVKRTAQAPPVPLRTSSNPGRTTSKPSTGGERNPDRWGIPRTARGADKDITAEHPAVSREAANADGGNGDDAGNDPPRKGRRRQKRR
jgi:serine/threonine protein kinase